ncbi:MAG: NAD-dependent epimerase/dehydratase family protein [candidate division KSB1 bacterium]|nr:NAD-dependent epimerase/dehydratase family protein [candidate division KSB1 bacterium]
MRALVTGASGFIGGFLVQRLLDDGVEVVCLMRKTSSRAYLPVDRIRIHLGSLQDVDSLKTAVQGVDVVFHLAGATKALSREDFFQINAGGTQNLLEACRQSGVKLPRFVLVSSLAAAGPSADRQGISEEDEPRPVSHYGQSKLEAERIAAEYGRDLPVTIVRPPVVYGPRDRDVYQYFKQVNMGFALYLGREPRYFSIIHVRDLVEGIWAAGRAAQAVGRTYFLTNPQPESWRGLGQMIARAVGKEPVPIVLPEWTASVVAVFGEMVARITRKPPLLGFDKIREMREKYWVCRGTRAETELGFRPAISAEEGIEETAKWYRDHGWL